MRDQVGFEALRRHVEREAPYWARTLPLLPRLVHQALEAHMEAPAQAAAWRERYEAERRRARWLAAGLTAVALILAVQSLVLLMR
jgi:ubiquinone biosynthesis protein